MTNLTKTIAIAAGLAIALPLANASAAPSPDFRQEAIEGNVRFDCNQAMYEFLPGAFNSCLGLRKWRQHQYATAIELYKLAAGWGSKPAQHVLGLIYFNGKHVPVNRPLGIAWLMLSIERQDDPERMKVAQAAVNLASAQELQQARTLLLTMRDTYSDKHAARRAQNRYNRAISRLNHGQAFGANLCAAGLAGGTMPQQTFFRRSNEMSRAGAVTPRDYASDLTMRPQRAGFSGCPPALVAVVKVNKAAQRYFSGWYGHVSVGPLTMPGEKAADDR